MTFLMWMVRDFLCPGAKPVLPRREDDPKALVEHLRATSGCTCTGGGVIGQSGLPALTLASYYCVVHGEALRAKYPTAEAVEAAMAVAVPEPEKSALGALVASARRVSGPLSDRALRPFMESLEEESYDEGRLDLLKSMCPPWLTAEQVAEVMETFSYDEGRVKALRVLKKARAYGDSKEVALAVGPTFDYDDDRALGRKVVLG